MKRHRSGWFSAALKSALAFCFMTPISGDPTESRPGHTRFSARPFFRKLALQSMRHGDAAVARGHLVAAARYFATAGITYRFIGASRPATVAFLELGGVHLALGRPERLPGVVDSIRALRPPAAGLVFVRVCGEILANAVTHRPAFVELLDQLRQQRQNGDPERAPQPAEDVTVRPSSGEEGTSA